jgi:hypothetical protein
MALQVRRGTNTERLGITPLAGELVYTTDTKQLYVGDGSTAGGITSISGTIDSVLADTTPQLGGDLDLNSHNITGTGNINITGTITATGNINLGDGIGSDIVVFGGAIQGHLVPDTDITWNLGSPTKQFNEAWISQLNVENQLTVGRIQGDLIADDSTVVFDASTGVIAAAQLAGTATINVTGNLTGNVDGDLTGSIFSDNSTLLVNGTNGTIPGENITGSLSALTSVQSNLVVGEATTGLETPLRAFGYYDGTDGHYFSISRSRGTQASPSNLLAGDTVGAISWYDLSAAAGAAQIVGRIDPDGTPGASVAPGRLEFITSSNAGTPIVRAHIDYAGTFVTNGIHNGRTTAPTGIPFYSLGNSNITSDGPRLLMRRSRGTYDTPLTVVDGDAIHRLSFGAHDGTSYVDSAYITARVDGTVSTGIMPTSIDVKTTTQAGGSSTNASFRADSHTEFNGAVKLAVYADNTARDAVVTAPEAGMMIFNTTLTKFQGYTGSIWVDLN